jgi:hypothetical protein
MIIRSGDGVERGDVVSLDLAREWLTGDPPVKMSAGRY